MAKWGNCNFRELTDFQKKLERMEKRDMAIFCEKAAKELAARLLRKVILRTHTGQYPESSGKMGGTLKRGWTSVTEEEAMSGKNKIVNEYVKALNITKIGNTYQIDVINPVKYASYVEYGHRTRNRKRWVPGQFMLTISESELTTQAPQILENKLKKYLEECLNGK